MPVPGDGSEDATSTAPAPQDQDQDRDSVRYAAGTAEAATPTPTPVTTPNDPPPRTDTQLDTMAAPGPAEEPASGYAAPVDPWAEAEAAANLTNNHVPHPMAPAPAPEPPTALIEGGPAHPLTAAGDAEPEHPSYKKGFWILGGVAATATVALAVTAAVLLWPGFPALDYHALDQVRGLTPVAPITSGWADAEVIGDRAYFAGTVETGEAAVTAYNIGSGREVWKNIEAGPAKTWKQMIALPDAVALISDPDYTTSLARLVVLDGTTGVKRWDYSLGSSDTVHFGAGMVLVDDHEHSVLHGLELTSGDEKWQLANPDGSASSTLLGVTTPDDLTGPAGTQGRPFAPEVSDDDQVVQIAADRSARVINIKDGTAGESRRDVAYPSDKTVAHNGRLFVEESSTDRLLAYDLAGFGTGGEPAVVYTAPKDADVSDLTPCGDNRICIVETIGYAHDKSQIVAFDLETHKEAWRKPAPDVETLVPVGDAVLASTDETNTLFDATGTPQWTDFPGTAARLDAGNVLRFSGTLTPSVGDQFLDGVHPGDKAAQIGPLRDVRGSSCAWNTSVVACVRAEDFVVERFAG
ncbi:outer membrane protein assembly factor BamB family protein [Actinoplanes palleronii]|uniref:Pyrrolo-quinoline quinone repeat domain-containing protein n=1 Tax=Actinoplanes palleronii TaxID=113570 RepID=A0ABQ4BJ40_9ACTN|nr:PQQ-binding-like beta-propeller repeat protein [Actinoplanes palleronii]GIE70702.1 hypothetical protein Apa02nite_068100 [Actinoplanes palleronii]